MQLSTFKLDDEHKGTVSQKLEEAQEVKFTLGRPKAALLKVQQGSQVVERPSEGGDGEVREFRDLAVAKRAPAAATSIATPDSERSKVGAGLPPKRPTATAALASLSLTQKRVTPCNSPTPRVRPPSRGEFREYGPGEYNAMITRRARSFEREAGAGCRGGSLGLRKRDASWDRKWRNEQERNR